MGSDTLPGTPGNQKAVAVFEVGSGTYGSNWEIGAPALGNGVMWLQSTAYNTDQPSNLAFSFYYSFINTGPAVTGATIACGFDNYGYIVLNGVKYPSTNTLMNLGYEGIGGSGNVSLPTVNIPTGLNTLELRVVNRGFAGDVWQNQGQMGGPTAAWLAITSGATVLVKTNATWNCTQFNYPGKFIAPLLLGDVAENAGLSRPYSMIALAGKIMYDNSANPTTLALPLSLVTAVGKTFVPPSWTSTVFNPGLNGNWYAWDARVPTANGTYSCRAVASGNASKFMTWTCTVSGGSANVSGLTLTNVNNGGSPRIAWTTSFASGVANFNSFPYSEGGLVYFLIDLWYTTADATYILTVTKTA